jgi:hypothetical protein
MRNVFRSAKWILGLMTIASCAFATHTGYTDDIPGCRCVQATNATPSIYYYAFQAQNNNASVKTFLCPITLGQNASILPYEYAEDAITWSAYVDDVSAATNVSCVLKSCNEGWSSCFTTSTSSSSGSGGVQALTGNTQSSLGGTGNYWHYLQCDVPGLASSVRSGIVSYRVVVAGTDTL